MKIKTIGITGLLLFALMVPLTGCRQANGLQTRRDTVDFDSLENEIQRIVTQLLVNSRELDKIYDSLHTAAVEEAGNSTNDIQLGNIRKTYLHVNQARMVSYFQIRLLSDFPYIKKDRRNDFLTLRARDLDRAVSEMEDAESYLEIYAAFIKSRQVLVEIERARKTMLGNIYLYEKLLMIIRPGVNPAGPFTVDPYSPFAR